MNRPAGVKYAMLSGGPTDGRFKGAKTKVPKVSTYFEPLLFDSVGVVDSFIVIFHVRDSVAAFFQLTGHHSLNKVSLVGGLH